VNAQRRSTTPERDTPPSKPQPLSYEEFCKRAQELPRSTTIGVPFHVHWDGETNAVHISQVLVKRDDPTMAPREISTLALTRHDALEIIAAVSSALDKGMENGCEDC